jgi:hypothetical protein
LLFKFKVICAGKGNTISKNNCNCYSIGLLKDERTVIETLNSYHALTITKEEVEKLLQIW